MLFRHLSLYSVRCIAQFLCWGVSLFWLVLPLPVPLVSSLPRPDPATQPLASQLQDCPPASLGYLRISLTSTTSVKLSSCSPCAVSATSTTASIFVAPSTAFCPMLSRASLPRELLSVLVLLDPRFFFVFRPLPSGTGRQILRSFIGILTLQSTSRTDPTFLNSSAEGASPFPVVSFVYLTFFERVLLKLAAGSAAISCPLRLGHTDSIAADTCTGGRREPTKAPSLSPSLQRWHAASSNAPLLFQSLSSVLVLVPVFLSLSLCLSVSLSLSVSL